jgi:Flp pilus assembly protein TadD
MRDSTVAAQGGPIQSSIQYSGACPVTETFASSPCVQAGRRAAACLAWLGLVLTVPAVAAVAATPGTAGSLPAVRAAPETRAADPYTEVQRLMRAGDPAAALARLEALPAEQAREARWRFLRAVLLAELGRLEDAAALYTSLTQEFPELAEPYNNLAVLRAAQGRLDDARIALEAALRADPSHREARENLGDVYVRLALRLWEGLAAAPTRPEADAELARKLRLARQIGTQAR